MTEIDTGLLDLAGFALAHAAGSVETGEPLCTFAMVAKSGKRELIRYEAASVTEGIQGAHSDVAARLRGEGFAVVAIDGFIVGKDGSRKDALILELLNAQSATVAVVFQAYRRGPFALEGRPVSPQQLLPAQFERILTGARAHPEGVRLFPG